MEATPTLDRLHTGLRAVLRQAKLPLREGSRRLGHYPGYLGRVLGGRAYLRVRELFRLFEIVGLHPQEFFEIYFPLGGDPVHWARSRLAEEPLPPSELDLDLLRRGLRQQDAGMKPEDWAERAGWQLREWLRASGRSQAELSRALGLAPAALGQRVRSSRGLRVADLLAVLDAIGRPPERFFFQLVFPDRTLTASLLLDHVLDRWEATQKSVIAQRRKDLEAEDRKTRGKKPDPPAGEPEGEDVEPEEP